MKVTIDWELANGEGFGLQVRAYDHPNQYKIDIWADKAKPPLWRMRLDGFGHLRMYHARNLWALAQALANVQGAEVVNAKCEHWEMLHQLWQMEEIKEEFEEPSAESVLRYFIAAREQVIKEIAPLLEVTK